MGSMLTSVGQASSGRSRRAAAKLRNTPACPTRPRAECCRLSHSKAPGGPTTGPAEGGQNGKARDPKSLERRRGRREKASAKCIMGRRRMVEGPRHTQERGTNVCESVTCVFIPKLQNWLPLLTAW